VIYDDVAQDLKGVPSISTSTLLVRKDEALRGPPL
jgi:hypothetical protein